MGLKPRARTIALTAPLTTALTREVRTRTGSITVLLTRLIQVRNCRRLALLLNPDAHSLALWNEF